MENCLKNKVVIVTGSSSGIGEAIAVELVSQGAKVAIIGRREHKLKLVAARCELVGKKTLAIRADVTKDDDRRMIIKRTIKHFGKLNVLVNCAGVAKFISILSNEAIEMFDEALSINLRSIVHLVHLSASYLIASKGSINNIGSVGGIAPIASEKFSYCISKAALHHFTKCLALELASKNVRVNLIAPGPVRTYTRFKPTT
ncbi:uncharacterized protein LOC114243534 [Bombyx mandarina]|uniref:Uncharacterized protein LOC114243534 n=1 Tax=Bombyx mandarina TaxID=7092 RepID=A0A6J2JPA7_BOMMA|nr:uncharacterized protein LOC114243534 [Bombyx mandarina]